MKNKFPKILYDHWLIIFSIIIGTAGVSVAVKHYDSLQQLILQVISHSAAGWIVLLLFIVISGIKKLTKKKQSSVTFLSSDSPLFSPKYMKTNIRRNNLFGVVWHIWIGSDSLSTDNRERLWADGPFCSRCDYELDRDEEKDRWICINCNRSFKIPKNVREGTREKVIKIFEAEIRKQQNKKQEPTKNKIL